MVTLTVLLKGFYLNLLFFFLILKKYFKSDLICLDRCLEIQHLPTNLKFKNTRCINFKLLFTYLIQDIVNKFYTLQFYSAKPLILRA